MTVAVVCASTDSELVEKLKIICESKLEEEFIFLADPSRWRAVVEALKEDDEPEILLVIDRTSSTKSYKFESHEGPVLFLEADAQSMDWDSTAFELVDFLRRPFTSEELAFRVSSLHSLYKRLHLSLRREEKLQEMMVLLKAVNNELEELSSLDALTNIPNRRRFNEHFEIEWKRAFRNQTEISLLMVDIDFFKKFNDEYGHIAGDECLREVAKQIKLSLRRPGDMVARYGGEEFIAVLPQTSRAGAYVVAEAMRERVESIRLHSQLAEKSKVTVSVGLATCVPKSAEAGIELLEAADHALYLAKQGGRNQVSQSSLQLRSLTAVGEEDSRV